MRLAASISDEGSLSRAPDSFSRIQASRASRRTNFLRPSRTTGKREACRTRPSVALETWAFEHLSSRATSFKVSSFLCGSTQFLRWMVSEKWRRWRQRISWRRRSDEPAAGSTLPEEGFAHRETGFVAASGGGVCPHGQAIQSPQRHLRRSRQLARRTVEAEHLFCSGCSAFSRPFPSLGPVLEPRKRGAERGAPNCSKCSPFRSFAPKPIQCRSRWVSVRWSAPRAPWMARVERSLGGSDPLFLGAGPPKTLPASPRVAPAQTTQRRRLSNQPRR